MYYFKTIGKRRGDYNVKINNNNHEIIINKITGKILLVVLIIQLVHNTFKGISKDIGKQAENLLQIDMMMAQADDKINQRNLLN